jgi:hypothetical protein
MAIRRYVGDEYLVLSPHYQRTSALSTSQSEFFLPSAVHDHVTEINDLLCTSLKH